MILKKPVLSSASFALVQPLQCSPQLASSSPNRTAPYQQRAYAHAADARSFSYDGTHVHWPDSIAPHKTPTPYQIFGLKRHEPYSKATFYKLVKLYHPDRYQHEPSCPETIRSLPQHIRVERYRLIVAANAILSDPARKSAYDRFGMGWTGHSSTHSAGSSAGYEKSKWKPGEDPMKNATWEDWERWHNRNSKDAQAPLYASNGMFLSFIVILATLGGIGEATRAKSWGHSMLAQRDITHADASRELRRSREAATAAGDRDDRIQAFLRHKDSTTYADEAYRRLLPRPEVCTSKDAVSER